MREEQCKKCKSDKFVEYIRISAKKKKYNIVKCKKCGKSK